MSGVLVVEDERHLAEGLRFNLEAEGYSVDTVHDAETALTFLLEEQRPYDVIVLDVMLPGKRTALPWHPNCELRVTLFQS